MKIQFKLKTKFFVRIAIGSLLLLSSFWIFDMFRHTEMIVKTREIQPEKIIFDEADEFPTDEIKSIEFDFNDTLLVVEKIIPEERYEREMPELPTQPVVAVYEKKDIISEIKELLTYIVGLLNGVLGMILLFQKVFKKKTT